MNKILLAVFCLFGFINAQSQCIAEAGQNTTICMDAGIGAVFLGGSPSAIGGTPPYTYKWETSYTLGSNTYYASTFLNDTSLSNPQLTNFAQDSLLFYLTVTDSLGNSCRDSVEIRFCQFFMTLEDKRAYITQGDTVQLYHSVWSNCTPLQIQWFPNYNIANSTSETPSVWPDTSMIYSAIITDSAGCTISDGFMVYVAPVSVQEFSNNIKFKITPNPTSGILNIEFNEATLKNVLVLNIYGQRVYHSSTKNQQFQLNLSEHPPGIYIIEIRDDEKKESVRIIKE